MDTQEEDGSVCRLNKKGSVRIEGGCVVSAQLGLGSGECHIVPFLT